MKKKMFSYGLLLLAVFIPFIGYAADNKPVKTQKQVAVSENPDCYKSKLEIEIDNIEKECIENSPTQGGMNKCVGKSLEAWDKALNAIYGKLMNRLDENNKRALRKEHSQFLNLLSSGLLLQSYPGIRLIMKVSTTEGSNLKKLIFVTF